MYFLLFFLLVIIFLNISISINIMISRNNNVNKLEIIISIYKFKIFTIKIPFLYFKIKDDNIYIEFYQKVILYKKILNEKKKQFKLNDKLYNIEKNLKRKFFSILYNEIKRYIRIHNILLTTNIGNKDAFTSAILNGLIYSLYSNLFYYLDSKFYIINLNYLVNTIYNRNVFEFEFNCLFKIKIIYIIKSILSLKIKGGE
ncbi:DUF2953 domain-containing protein [Senegalia massiliensis]|uniref:DUF2953 domain-containing protein n=1 Tax=Senegalia massiliensis TaxID=1720316 RepID=A0A845QZJ4_9CLOT|nr:DUF2953 domain-containing protein [Senegalia massiliensis]NBI06608.1 DUF2953 domain-containing protein [Senegalia massiliensis]